MTIIIALCGVILGYHDYEKLCSLDKRATLSGMTTHNSRKCSKISCGRSALAVDLENISRSGDLKESDADAWWWTLDMLFPNSAELSFVAVNPRNALAEADLPNWPMVHFVAGVGRTARISQSSNSLMKSSPLIRGSQRNQSRIFVLFREMGSMSTQFGSFACRASTSHL